MKLNKPMALAAICSAAFAAVAAEVSEWPSGTAAPINGRLRFYGAATLEAFKTASSPLGSATLSDDDFSEGETATAEIPLSGETPPAFFKAKMKGGIPDQGTIQELMEAEIEMAPIAKAERVALARELARELGCSGEDVDTVQEAIGNIFDCTSGGGLGSMEDMMDAGGVPPGVGIKTKVEVLQL